MHLGWVRTGEQLDEVAVLVGQFGGGPRGQVARFGRRQEVSYGLPLLPSSGRPGKVMELGVEPGVGQQPSDSIVQDCGPGVDADGL